MSPEIVFLVAVTLGFGKTALSTIPDNIGRIRPSHVEQDWVILLKGVAGVPGDLYELWAGTLTANQNNTQAMTLTSTFKGHYKPEIANDWNPCKFDKIKLAVYKNGIEKAYIIFDARGANKTNWMDPSRIMSSTYKDIQTAPHDIFSLKGDPSLGREFYASSESNSCDAYGWIMVSTNGTCFYERLSAKPAFYYSPTSARSHWGFSNPGEGDVIAILGHIGVCEINSAHGHNYTGVVTTKQTDIIVETCIDVFDNCAEYGSSSCVAPYDIWAEKYCAKTCNFCNAGIVTTKQPDITVKTCTDVLDNCAFYGSSSCVAPYDIWAEMNCARTCNFCSTSKSPSAHNQETKSHYPTTTITPVLIDSFRPCSEDQGWLILMKGMAGVPGDLYQLWSGKGTANQYNAQAMNLTSSFKGHYKPDIANEWKTCKFDKVKLSVCKNGFEKAYITFDTRGANKTNWMDPSRIVLSTYRDIQTAPHDIFSLKGDPSSGREFYASSESNNCDAYGWIMVSTKGTCFYETLSAKPAFYYSTTTTRSHWGFSNPGQGDVLAILGHSEECGTQVENRNHNTVHYVL